MGTGAQPIFADHPGYPKQISNRRPNSTVHTTYLSGRHHLYVFGVERINDASD